MKILKILLLLFVLLAGYFVYARYTYNNEELDVKRLQEKAAEAKKYVTSKGFNTDYCILVDMSIHSGKKRMFVWSFKDDKVIISTLCCHGIGGNSTQDTPSFSNVPGSNCTSLGKYKIGIRSYSRWGIHVHYKLHGLESTNNNAFQRIVVLHSYDYVPDYEIYPAHLPLGYSLGCPVICNEAMTEIDKLLQKQTTPVMLWIYN
jgi:hypothetical protein